MSCELQVLTLVRESAGAADDDHSQQVATTALASVVPTWVDSGRDVTLLWKTVTDALPALPAHRRVPLLATLLRTAGGAPALPAGLLVLLQHVVAHATDKQLKKAGKATAAAAGKPAAAAADNLWMLDVAGQLAEQVCVFSHVHTRCMHCGLHAHACPHALRFYWTRSVPMIPSTVGLHVWQTYDDHVFCTSG